MHKKQFMILIILLVIGFASVTTTLILNGNVGVGVELDDFDVIFIEALLDGKEDAKATISKDKKTIIFTTDKFINKGDSARLDYKVKNTSTQYDADVTINCTNEANEYVTVTSSFDGNTIPLVTPVNIQAQEVKNGYIDAELTKTYAGEDTSIEIKCKIIFTATSRETYAYSLMFDSNGGSEIDDKIVILDNSYGELATPTKEGYNFQGWYDENNNKVDSSTVLNSKGNKTLYAKWSYICPYDVGKEWTFGYTGGEQNFILPCDGNYRLETWGAQGGGYSSYIGGYGAYAVGNVYLTHSSSIYVNVGESGTTGKIGLNGILTNGSYNGGGANTSNQWGYGSTGGGATHIATNSGLLANLSNLKDKILIVSAGGGGGGKEATNIGYCYGGHAGGITGSVGSLNPNRGAGGGTVGSVGNQTSGAGFGIGGSSSSWNGGGGSGIYGGKSGCGGGGGASYIGNPLLSNKVMYCYKCTQSNEESTKTVSTTCTSSTPTANCAKQGNGYAKITLVSID